MIDYLLRGNNKEEIQNNFPQFFIEGEPNTSYCFWVKVYQITGTEEVNDPEFGTYTKEIKEYLPYDYLWVALDIVDQDLIDDVNCMFIADRNKTSDFIIHSKIPQEETQNYFIEPIIAGSNYPFGIELV